MGIFSLNKHVALAVKAVCWLARLVRWRSFLRAKRRGRLSAICAGIGRRDRPVLKPARQRRCSAWMSRKCSGIGYGSSLFETFSGVSQRRNSALCLCQMRRKRLIRPTNSSKFNILQKSCRPDKRSASGNLAFETVCLFLAGCDVNAPSGIAKLKITRLLSPRYHAAQRCG